MDVKEVIYSAEKVSVLSGVDPLVSILPTSGHCGQLQFITVGFRELMQHISPF